MPIEFKYMQDYDEYKIDYSMWKKELSNLRILHDSKIQEVYLDSWMKALIKADNESVDYYSKPQNLRLEAKERLEAPEVFQKAINYKSNTVYVHFRVSRLIQAIERIEGSEQNAHDIDLRLFSEKGRIDWTETTDYSKVKDTPIIIIPFIIGANVQFVVIDGNHRITDAIKKNKSTIKCHSIISQSLVDNNFFCTDFDKLLYVFHNEVIWLGTNLMKNENISDTELLKDTYFMSGKVHVWGEN